MQQEQVELVDECRQRAAVLTARIQSLQAQVQEFRTELGRRALAGYAMGPPSHAQSFAIFDGMWSSHIPGYGLGSAGLFSDDQLKFFEFQCGGFARKRVLELGPLEGGHTFMLASAGAASITAIESNRTAFLKCLIVQNALKFHADFMLGDFNLFLEACSESYDFVLASGVLYHMIEPWTLLRHLTRCGRAIGIWTHYYDADVIDRRDDLKIKFSATPVVQRVGCREIHAHKFSYMDALSWGGFCGGMAQHSYWLRRDDIIGLLEDEGFRVEIGSDMFNHLNGPAFTLFAQRVSGI